MSGSFAELDPPGRLVLNWRFSSWEEGVTSRVEITLTEPEPGNTIMVLNQVGARAVCVLACILCCVCVRFSSWEEGVTSRVEITLAGPEPGNTIMVMNQVGRLAGCFCTAITAHWHQVEVTCPAAVCSEC